MALTLRRIAYFLLLSCGCSGPAGLLNFGATRTFSDRSKIEMKDIVAEVVAAEMSSVTTEMKDFTAETVATTTQTIYGDAKWVVIGMLGLAAMAALAWFAERIVSLLYKRTQAKLVNRIANGGPVESRARNPPDGGDP